MGSAARRRGVAFAVLTGWLLAVGSPPVAAEVTGVTGSAFGYQTDVSLFGGPSTPRGPEPTIELAGDASNSPQDATVDSAAAQYGPAQIFRSGSIEVHGEATLGEGGSVTTSTRVEGDPDTEARPGPLLFDRIESSCTADEDGTEATTTVMGGVVETSYDPETQLPATTEEVPENPEPGYAVEGTIDHVGDRYRIVFNEQVENGDGSTTVYAAHMYLLGDIAVGDLYVGKAVCGVTATPTTDAGATSSETASASPAPASPSPTATPTPTPEGDATPEADTGPSTAALAGVGVLAALAVVGGAVLLMRRGNGGDEPGS